MRNLKIRGRKVASIEGCDVYATLRRAKRAGRDRLWFQIRQSGDKEWRVRATLAYPRGLDVRFEREPAADRPRRK